MDTGDAVDVLQLVRREHDGEAYLRAIRDDLTRLPERVRALIDKELSQIARTGLLDNELD
jgi:hypothetical protein